MRELMYGGKDPALDGNPIPRIYDEFAFEVSGGRAYGKMNVILSAHSEQQDSGRPVAGDVRRSRPRALRGDQDASLTGVPVIPIRGELRFSTFDYSVGGGGENPEIMQPLDLGRLMPAA